MAYLKKLVSKKKRRFLDDGFDLDLSYIKSNIVAMGFPSENIEGVFRNHIDEILRFLETKHKDHYKVYNLCSERQYDPIKFQNRVANYPFDDHNAPPFQLMKPYCDDMDEFLSSDEKNVAIVHCKAGKGRTGVMICAYLLHKSYFKSCKEALEYYGDARTSNKKGVTIPSQRRYVYYYAHLLRHKLVYMPTTLLITGFMMEAIPAVYNGTSPFFYVWQSKVKIYSSKSQENPKKYAKSISFTLPQPLPVCGDIKVQFYSKDRAFKKDLMFQFWFNTFFVSGLLPKSTEGETSMETQHDKESKTLGGGITWFELQKEDLDKANKDKKNKIFPPNFKLKVKFTVPDMNEELHSECQNDESDGLLRVPGTPTFDRPSRKPVSRSTPKERIIITHSVSQASIRHEGDSMSGTDDESEFQDKVYDL